jgi:hypothetical protein
VGKQQRAGMLRADTLDIAPAGPDMGRAAAGQEHDVFLRELPGKERAQVLIRQK